MFTPQELGVAIITMTSRYDPARMAAREKYWLDVIVQEYAKQYRENGFVDGLGFSFFSKPKAPKIPWSTIYAEARPLAKKYARDEEDARIAEESYKQQVVRQKEITRSSEAAASFQLPEGVTAVSRGSLVIQPKGQPVERKVVGK